MDNKLLIVESPTKARTIKKYLGKGYEVVATVGHIRDLPKSKMGVDLTSFEPEYVLDESKKKVISQLQKASKKADQIYLATDLDREGEAIAFHVAFVIGKKTAKRITFHEITAEAVEQALKSPRKIDMNLVNAQQGRRVLDRVVGYTLSPVLWKKVRRGLSAGRVQSVAVRLIVEREAEIEKFLKEKFFKVFAQLGGRGKFVVELARIGDKNFYEIVKLNLFDGSYSYRKTKFIRKDEVDGFVKSLDKNFEVTEVKETETKRNPLPPFTTSKLQQAAARWMGWSGKQTMSVAQKLYEEGLITYHRTDSVYLSDKAVASFRKFIENKYGAEYVPENARFYKNKSKNAQEAHEAIRPTDVNKFDEIEADTNGKKLYSLIWRRAVASQAAAAKMKRSKLTLVNKNSFWKAEGVRMLFDGFLKITQEKHEDQILPELKVGDKLDSDKIWGEEQETSPPPRYSDASLVQSLEKQGIGRPSTYAPIMSTIQSRQYVVREEGKFSPTVLGQATNKFLVKNFADILSLPFTAEMEEDLDRVAAGKTDWQKMMKSFYKVFAPTVKKVEKNADRVEVETEKINEKCPECKKGELVIRLGRFGKFISCNRFPECRYTRAFKEMAGFKCPECGADGVIKRTRKGRKFFGCSNYPKCKWAGWKKP